MSKLSAKEWAHTSSQIGALLDAAESAGLRAYVAFIDTDTALVTISGSSIFEVIKRLDVPWRLRAVTKGDGRAAAHVRAPYSPGIDVYSVTVTAKEAAMFFTTEIGATVAHIGARK